MANQICIRYKDRTFQSTLLWPEGPGSVLEVLFAAFNHGSGQECDNFLADPTVRSMSVGDFVCLDGLWFVCASSGWKPISVKIVKRWFCAFDVLVGQPFRGIGADCEKDRCQNREMASWAAGALSLEKFSFLHQ